MFIMFVTPFFLLYFSIMVTLVASKIIQCINTQGQKVKVFLGPCGIYVNTCHLYFWNLHTMYYKRFNNSATCCMFLY